MLVQEAAKGPLRWSSSQAASCIIKKGWKRKSIQSLNQKIKFILIWANVLGQFSS